jgi:predicted DCC family thiol-disulfide oxidoreductase YuxK
MAGAIILFDGVCNLCSLSVQFIIDRDATAYFQFASMQSAAGHQILAAYHLTPDAVNSVVLIEAGRCYFGSDAALRIAQRLPKWRYLGPFFWLVPRPIREWGYQRIAMNRYRWFGQSTTCRVPTPELQHRFLI